MLISQLFSLSGVSSFALADDNLEIIDDVNIKASTNESSNSSATSLNATPEITPPEITYTITNPLDTNPSVVRIAFDATGVVDYSFDAEGIDECAVARAASEGKIAPRRLESYRAIYKVLKNKTTY